MVCNKTLTRQSTVQLTGYEVGSSREIWKTTLISHPSLAICCFSVSAHLHVEPEKVQDSLAYPPHHPNYYIQRKESAGYCCFPF